MRTLGPKIRTFDTRKVSVPQKLTEAVYSSPEWRDLIADIIAERGRKCEDCGKTNCRVYGDHVVELKDGGGLLDRRNVRIRCASCHVKKTNRARLARHLA